MLLSNAAVLLLGALQPALGKPAIPRPMLDGSKNEIALQKLTATETVIHYLAPNPGCGPNVRAWVGVWPADACNPYTADYKAWSYVEPTQGRDQAMVRFNHAELGIGEYKAAFVCEDGRRQPWLVSQTFTVDGPPPAKDGQCAYRKSIFGNEWAFRPCDGVASVCFDCVAGCDICWDCRKQCGQAKNNN